MPELTTLGGNSIAVVLNPAAGRGTDLSAVVLGQRPDARVMLAHNASEVPTLAAAAVREGTRIIVAGGGDGTIRTIAPDLVGKDAVLAVLPLGTRNHFAQDIGIPLDVDGAFRVMLTGAVRRIDVGVVNGRAFLLYAALGLYPVFVRSVERYETRERRHGIVSLMRVLWSTLRRFAMLHVSIAAVELHAKHNSPFVFIANNVAMCEHLPIAVITRPELAVYTAHQVGRTELLTLLVQLWFGRVGGPAHLSLLRRSRADRE